MGFIDIETPEGVRAAVLQSLGQHEILPRGAQLPPSINYDPGCFEFLHECHDCGNRMMRVVGDAVLMEGGRGLMGEDGQPVPDGFHELHDGWEEISGRVQAMFYDPRWLIARLEELSVTSQSGNRLSLSGKLPPEKLGMRIGAEGPLAHLVGYSRTQEGFEWARQEFLAGFEQAQDVGYLPGEVSRFVDELQQLREEEIPGWVDRFLKRPYIFQIGLNAEFLPTTVVASQNAGIVPFPAEGITFEYRRKN